MEGKRPTPMQDKHASVREVACARMQWRIIGGSGGAAGLLRRQNRIDRDPAGEVAGGDGDERFFHAPPKRPGAAAGKRCHGPRGGFGAFPRPRPEGPLRIRAARRAWFPSEMSGRYPGHGVERSEVSGLELQCRRS
jgi:hypothetical protein